MFIPNLPPGIMPRPSEGIPPGVAPLSPNPSCNIRLSLKSCLAQATNNKRPIIQTTIQIFIVNTFNITMNNHLKAMFTSRPHQIKTYKKARQLVIIMPPFDPTIMIGEFVYTLIIVVFCGIIYWKTKEIYELTKYKGIKYFRNTFLFLGLSYLLRFVTHMAMMTTRALDYFIPRNAMMGITQLPVGNLSTMALFYLMYSLIWKRIEQTH